jgi:energy-coupling factor transport system permease protein
LIRAATAGALDRALDVAAALEVRGYGAARSAPRGRTPWTRHDIAFATCALAVVAIAGATRLAGLAPFTAYPSLRVSVGLGGLIACAALLACALLPFIDRRGIER